MSLGMIFLTTLGLFVGLGVLYLAWRFVDSQPSDIDPRPSAPPSPAPPQHKADPPLRNDEERHKPGRMHPSTILALIGMTIGLAAILFVLFFGPSSPLR